MSLKLTIVNTDNRDYKSNVKHYKRVTNDLVSFRKSLKGMGKVLSRYDRVKEVIQSEMGDMRSYLKESNLEKTVKELKVVSDRTWTFYNETMSDEWGITTYDKANPVNIKIDTLIRFSGKAAQTVHEVKELREQALAEVRSYREKRKQLSFIEKEYQVKTPDGQALPFKSKYKVYAGGGFGDGGNNYNIHLEPGQIMRLKAETKLRKIFEDKVPKDSSNHVGVEIEFVSKAEKYDLAKLLVAHGVEEYVTLKNDGSLRAEGEYKYCHELCVVFPESKTREVLRNVINALDEAKCRVNKRCGLHVHIDVRNRDKSIVFNNLVKSQTILFGMNPVSRITGKHHDGTTDTVYSKKMEHTDFDTAVANIGNDRYFGINPLSFHKHKTVEVRLHSGSTNFEKIFNWVCILVGIAEATKKFTTASSKPETFCERFGFDEVILNYIKERMSKFRDKDGNHVSIEEVA